MSEPGPLHGQVALVTGGSRGLGRAMCLGLAAAGADVVVASRDGAACEQVAEQVRGLGRRALARSCHVGRWSELDGLAEAAYDAFGRVDVLVNNAGKSPLYDSLAGITEQHFDSVIGLNLKGPFRLSVLVGERMRAAGGGSIINVSSLASIRPAADTAPYSMAKAGLDAMTVALAAALAPVRVNAVLPGPFRTDVSAHWSAQTWERLEHGCALGRVGEPDEIAGAVVHLASPASSYTTGALLRVDGGAR